MTWARNLLVLGLLLGGAASLAAMLRPEVLRPGPLAETQARRARRATSADDFRHTLNEVNRAVRERWESAELTPAASADDALVARRMSLALAGTIPSLEEMRNLAEAPAESRLDEHLFHLLADRRSSNYLAERLARMLVGNEGGPFLVYRRRRFVSWLSDELHANRPYDRIIRQILTGQGLWTTDPETNFITATLQDDDEGKPDVNKLAVRVSRAMLGIRLDCAQCHDHPFDDRWKQTDFESLAAFFGRTGFKAELAALRGIQDGGEAYTIEDRETGEERTVVPAVPFASELLPADGNDRRRLARWLTDADNPAFARATVNRFWALLFGQPLVEPVDDIPLDDVPETLDLLARDFAEHNYDWRRLIHLITSTDAFRLESRARDDVAQHEVTSAHTRHWAAFPITRLRGEQVAGSLLQSANLRTIDHDSHILVRAIRYFTENDFLERYGDAGAQELEPQSGTIPQRLLMLNGNIVDERTKPDLVANASTRIAALAPNDETAVRTAYQVTLSRQPTATELQHFTKRLDGSTGDQRSRTMSDLVWSLVNSSEFSWNH